MTWKCSPVCGVKTTGSQHSSLRGPGLHLFSAGRGGLLCRLSPLSSTLTSRAFFFHSTAVLSGARWVQLLSCPSSAHRHEEVAVKGWRAAWSRQWGAHCRRPRSDGSLPAPPGSAGGHELRRREADTRHPACKLGISAATHTSHARV